MNLQVLSQHTAAVIDSVPFRDERYMRNAHLESWCPTFGDEYALLVAKKTDSDERQITELFRDRTEGLRVYQVTNPDDRFSGHFLQASWSIVINSVLRPSHTSNILVHETGHAVVVNLSNYFTAGRTEPIIHQNGLDKQIIGASVNVKDACTPNFSGIWLNEALIDLSGFRTNEQRYEVGYITGVILLSTLFDNIPNLETTTYESAFLTGDDTRAIDAINDAVYPGWTEEMGKHMYFMANNRPSDDGYNPIEEIESTVPEHLRTTYGKYWQQFAHN